MAHRTRRLAALAVAVPIALAGAGGLAGAAGGPVQQGLAAAPDPAGAPGRTLGLSRVIVPAGARLAAHTHPGTQIARIDSGTLTYTVEHGSVTVMRGDSSAPHVVRRITSGHTARLRAGQWIVERPGMVHRAANRTGRRVVILLATLFPTGAPASSPAR